MINNNNLYDVEKLAGQPVVVIDGTAFPVSVVGSSSSGSGAEFYKCAAVYGPYDVETVVISGCPVSDANGEYLPTDQTTTDWEGKEYPVYANGKGWYYGYSEYGGYGITQDFNNGLAYSGEVGGTWYDNMEWMPVDGMTGVKGSATLDTDVPKTWDGYKAVLSGGVYTFENTVTTGLTYSDIKPKKYGVYNDDATIKNEWLLKDYPVNGLAFFAPLTSDLSASETGQVMNNKGAVLTTLNEVHCAHFTPDNDRYIGTYIKSEPAPFRLYDAEFLKDSTYTVFFNFIVLSTRSDVETHLVRVGRTDGGGGGVSAGLKTIEDKVYFYAYGNNKESADDRWEVDLNTWYTVTIVFIPDTAKIYFGKTLEATRSHSYGIGRMGGQSVLLSEGGYNGALDGGIRNVMVYNRALSEAEIGQLVDKFGIIYPPEIIVRTPVTVTAYLENEISKKLSATVKHSTGETLTFSSSNMPAGLTLSSDGLITGTPTTIGSVTSTITLSYPGAESVQITLNWEIKEASEKPPVPASAICYFTMDDLGDRAVDDKNGLEVVSSGNMINSVDGIVGTCWESTDGNSYMRGANKAFTLPTAFTLNCFVNTNGDGTGGNRTLVDFGTHSDGNGFGIWFNSGKQWGWRIGSSFEYPCTLPTDKWTMLTFTWDGTNIKLYTDGVQSFTKSGSYSVSSSEYIGFFKRRDFSETVFGKLDEVLLCNQAMTADEIKDLYDSYTNKGGSEDTPTDKTYAYTVTKAPADYQDALGDYYPATAEEMMELYPQTGSYAGGQYYTNGNRWALMLSEGILEWTLNKYYPDYGGDPDSTYPWKWDMHSTCTSSTLPDTGNWMSGFDVVEYSGGGGGGTPVFKVTGDETNPEVNGDYYEVTPDNVNSCWDTSKKIYSNGSVFFASTSQWWNGWTVVRDISTTPFDDQGVTTSLAYSMGGHPNPWDVTDYNGDYFEITKY